MAEIVNLRRARRNKARAEKEREADANRAKHGVAKRSRDLAHARAEKEKHAVEAHKLDGAIEETPGRHTADAHKPDDET
jgi:hypothetical protein